MEFHILGPLEIVVDGRAVPAPAPRLCSLLAILLLRPHRQVQVGELIDRLWPDGAPQPANPTATVHTYVRRLRDIVGADVHLGEFREAVACITESLQYTGPTSNDQLVALVNRSGAYKELGELDLAAADLRTAEPLVDNRLNRVQWGLARAGVENRLGHYEQARRIATDVLRESREIGNAYDACVALQALAESEAVEYGIGRQWSRSLLARCCTALDRPAEAATHQAAANTLCHQTGYVPG
ncbi:AfsR/SARP family transcriptional regulator [Kribbella soli]|nr:winged helix-turn-helix domain-containing protein [Kribbella soli]